MGKWADMYGMNDDPLPHQMGDYGAKKGVLSVKSVDLEDQKTKITKQAGAGQKSVSDEKKLLTVLPLTDKTIKKHFSGFPETTDKTDK